MAEFSKEFIESENWDTGYDFCILDEFKRLKEGETLDTICEGFGFTRIHRNNNECLLWLPRKGEYINLDVLMKTESKGV